ncbi:zinc finger RNA-binding protein 2 [Eupeodes corollae]|uniref:zinc finger RNA-binding protein 2 n=1 Tax=Eupeodes corollae TaxID=290404 RepID=UPI0024915C5F|nr:zinc finger RNA-binding protein 2 [Eupeodes corollae]
MATNNYFPYGGTQYGAAASSPPVGYSANQAGYAVPSATPTSYNAQRTGYDQSYTTASGNATSFPAAAGPAAASSNYGYDYNRTLQSYDSSKTYYQQAASYSSAPTVSKTHYSAPPVRNPTPAAAAKMTANPAAANGAKDKINAGGAKPAATAAATVAPSYSNYDAALYSAATMYVAQQHSKTPAGNTNWQPFKKQGASNSGGHKMRAKPPPRVQQLHYCEVCKISCAGPQTYREHLEGQKHKKREASLKMQASATTTTQNRGNSYHCELCDVTCTGNDAYAAHVRGSKHQKVVKLHQKLGKPIPSDDPKKMSKINFVPAGTEATDAATKDGVVKADGGADGTAAKTAASDDGAAASDKIKPVGVEYIEEMKDDEGKILSFNCKLCDCKFNDPNAKEMHMKGRRHRLQYKRKVQPDLVVDYKPTLRHRRLADARAQRAMMQAEFGNGRRGSNFGTNEESGDGMMYWDERRRFDEEFDYGNWMQRGFQGVGPRGAPFIGRGAGGPPGHPFFGMMPGRRPESTDDRHAIARHAEIYPKEEELKTIQKIVSNTERALKFVSDVFEDSSQENGKSASNASGTGTGNGNGTSSEKKPEEKVANIKDGRDNQMFSFQKENENGANTPRLLKGVMRVGYLAKGLLLQGDSLVELVVLCSEKPTLGLLNRVADELPAKLKEVSSSNNTNEAEYSVELAVEDSAILVSDDAVTVKICLTSPLLRESQDAAGAGADEIPELPQKPTDFLPREPCLQALAELRHAKWFQARATGLQSCVMVIRILRDLCQRVPSWQAMNQWALELLIEKVISSAGFPLSPGDCLRRIMEAVSTGLLINGPGILDPCEKESRDALDGLTKQQREDLTVSAQQFLRLIAFRQIFKVLGMDQLPVVKFPMRPWRLNRKRRRSIGDGNNDEDKPDEKLSKKENGNGGSSGTTTLASAD